MLSGEALAKKKSVPFAQSASWVVVVPGIFHLDSTRLRPGVDTNPTLRRPDVVPYISPGVIALLGWTYSMSQGIYP